jgi:hypothetical protein
VRARRRAAGLLARAAITALAAASSALLACSSAKTAPTDTTGSMPAKPGGGSAYPTAGIGSSARGLDSSGRPNTAHGDVIADLAFTGYATGNPTGPLSTVSLADYFDPKQAKYTLVHIVAVAGWCAACGDETSKLVAALAAPSTDYASQGVVYLQVLVEGTAQHVGATPDDLYAWTTIYHPPFAELLDPEAQSLGELFAVADVPLNVDLDARSMEILQASTGEEDPAAVETWLAWVKANPATVYQ